METGIALQEKVVSSIDRAMLGLEEGSIVTLKSALSTKTWMIIGFFYLAENCLNYRKYKQGQITRRQFIKSVKYSTVSSLGSGLFGAAGTAAGFAMGTMVAPGVGSAVGAVTGGIIFSYFGSVYSIKFYEQIEEKFYFIKQYYFEGEKESDEENERGFCKRIFGC